MEIKITGNKIVKISQEDYENISRYKWHFDSSNGYVRASIYTDGILSHSYLHNLIMGKDLYGRSVDHINRDRLENTRENLRFTDRASQCRNTNKKSKTTTSRFPGVSKHKGGKWTARIRIPNGKYQHLGLFTNENEAALVYCCHALVFDDNIKFEQWNEIEFTYF